MVAKIDFTKTTGEKKKKTTGEISGTLGNILEPEGTIEVKYIEASSSGKILVG